MTVVDFCQNDIDEGLNLLLQKTGYKVNNQWDDYSMHLLVLYGETDT